MHVLPPEVEEHSLFSPDAGPAGHLGRALLDRAVLAQGGRAMLGGIPILGLRAARLLRVPRAPCNAAAPTQATGPTAPHQICRQQRAANFTSAALRAFLSGVRNQPQWEDHHGRAPDKS